MQKALIISCLPWSQSNRGIDIMTNFFIERDFYVNHVVFPKYPSYDRRLKKYVSGNYPHNFKQTFSAYCIPFDDNRMFWLPKQLKKVIFRSHINSIRSIIDFNAFDVIVVESGKGVLLYDILPSDKFIIYRQSDPLWLVYKDKDLIESEIGIYEKSNLILVPQEAFVDKVPDKFRTKVKVWKNGFNVPNTVNTENPYSLNGKKKCVYMGYTKINALTVIKAAEENPDCEFHIIGDCISRKERSKIMKNFDNVFFYGDMPSSNYIRYIRYADFAFIPYSNLPTLKYLGLHGKLLLFMFFGLPIVSYKLGLIDRSDVLFASTLDEFLLKIKVAKNMPKIRYQIDWEYFSTEGRKKELTMILSEYLPS